MFYKRFISASKIFKRYNKDEKVVLCTVNKKIQCNPLVKYTLPLYVIDLSMSSKHLLIFKFIMGFMTEKRIRDDKSNSL